MPNEKKVKITFKAHKELIKEMGLGIKKAGYGYHEKSRWVSEAIEYLISGDDYLDNVLEEKPIGKLEDNPATIFITSELRNKLDNAIENCLKKDPFKQGVQSSIIRTAIIQKLLRG